MFIFLFIIDYLFYFFSGNFWQKMLPFWQFLAKKYFPFFARKFKIVCFLFCFFNFLFARKLPENFFWQKFFWQFWSFSVFFGAIPALSYYSRISKKQGSKKIFFDHMLHKIAIFVHVLFPHFFQFLNFWCGNSSKK